LLGGDGSLFWELSGLRRAHGTAAAFSGLSGKGAREEPVGVLRAEMLRTVEQKLFRVPGRERRYSLMMSALSKWYFSCH